MEPHSHTQNCNSATYQIHRSCIKAKPCSYICIGSGSNKRSRSSHMRIFTSSSTPGIFVTFVYIGSSVAFWLVDCVTVTFGGSDEGMEYVDRFVGRGDINLFLS